MKVLPFVSVSLYIVAFLFDVLRKAMPNDSIQIFYWLFCSLANTITLYYVVVSFKRSKLTKNEESDEECQ